MTDPTTTDDHAWPTPEEHQASILQVPVPSVLPPIREQLEEQQAEDDSDERLEAMEDSYRPSILRRLWYVLLAVPAAIHWLFALLLDAVSVTFRWFASVFYWASDGVNPGTPFARLEDFSKPPPVNLAEEDEHGVLPIELLAVVVDDRLTLDLGTLIQASKDMKARNGNDYPTTMADVGSLMDMVIKWDAANQDPETHTHTFDVAGQRTGPIELTVVRGYAELLK